LRKENRREEVTLDWAAASVGLGGLVIAGLTLWLSFKERGAGHREYFYQKQLDAYMAVMNALYPFFNACQDYIVLNGFRLNGETRLKFRLEISRGSISKYYWNFHTQHQKWAILLPVSMQAQLSHFSTVLSAISAPDEIANQYPPALVNSADPGMDLAKAYSKVVAVAREGLGVEPLSEEILRLVGRSKITEDEKSLQAKRTVVTSHVAGDPD
jgi:hypothetical protein